MKIVERGPEIPIDALHAPSVEALSKRGYRRLRDGRLVRDADALIRESTAREDIREGSRPPVTPQVKRR